MVTPVEDVWQYLRHTCQQYRIPRKQSIIATPIFTHPNQISPLTTVGLEGSTRGKVTVCPLTVVVMEVA